MASKFGRVFLSLVNLFFQNSAANLHHHHCHFVVVPSFFWKCGRNFSDVATATSTRKPRGALLISDVSRHGLAESWRYCRYIHAHCCHACALPPLLTHMRRRASACEQLVASLSLSLSRVDTLIGRRGGGRFAGAASSAKKGGGGGGSRNDLIRTSPSYIQKGCLAPKKKDPILILLKT